ncbi:MAG TPA: hypothetical protein VEC57_18620 [Candidatus Limnocylindrales bacterium]|nr:hypothetical protein [Candidatus Limnocylindrales bacterium]
MKKAIIAAMMTGALGVASPALAIVDAFDDFDRADGPPGTNWEAITVAPFPLFEISANQACSDATALGLWHEQLCGDAHTVDLIISATNVEELRNDIIIASGDFGSVALVGIDPGMSSGASGTGVLRIRDPFAEVDLARGSGFAIAADTQYRVNIELDSTGDVTATVSTLGGSLLDTVSAATTVEGFSHFGILVGDNETADTRRSCADDFTVVVTNRVTCPEPTTTTTIDVTTTVGPTTTTVGPTTTTESPTTTTEDSTTTTTLPTPTLCDPDFDCRLNAAAPGKSSIKISTKVESKHSLKFKLGKGDAAGLEEFGDATSETTSYELCLYDTRGLILSTPIEGGEFWTAAGTGFKYTNKTGNQFGITSVKISATGQDEKTQIQVGGKGPAFEGPDLPVEGTLTAQFMAQTAAGKQCWELEFSAPSSSSDSGYSAKAP